MAYITPELLNASIPAEYRTAALDDSMTGNVTAAAGEICDAASREVDGYICPAYATPIANPPPNLVQSAISIALELLFIRRGISSVRISAMADAWRKTLGLIGERKLPLSATISGNVTAAAGAVVTEPSRTTRSDGGMFV